MLIQTICRNNLMAIATVYAKATGQSLGAVSKMVYGQSAFLRQFRTGKSTISLRKYDEVIGYFQEAWPPGLPWPTLQDAVFRPKPRKTFPAKGSKRRTNHLDTPPWNTSGKKNGSASRSTT